MLEPPNRHWLRVPRLKLVPETSTSVPPAIGPRSMLTDETAGSGTKVKLRASSVKACKLRVTSSGACSVQTYAPARSRM